MMRTEDGIVVFDGCCNFCSSTIRFFLKYDVAGRLAFAPLQSTPGRELMRRHEIDPADAGTMLLVKGGVAYTRSDAVLEIARDLGRWRWLRVFRVVPRRLRDRAYGVIARNRYKWFGRRDACFVPAAEQRSRFLDGPESEVSRPEEPGAQ